MSLQILYIKESFYPNLNHGAFLNGNGKTNSSLQETLGEISNKQKLNYVLDFECCCCEQPISMQKYFFTAISLDAHNDNIRNLAQNSASADIRTKQTYRTIEQR